MCLENRNILLTFVKEILINLKTNSMKTFENPRNIKEFVNQFGETMTMVMSENSTLWIYHNDCNKDFEKLDKFFLKYVLDKEEQIAIIEFVEECEIILEKVY